MRVAYLFLAHDSPTLIGRAIARLRTPQSRFFIHIDAKADIRAFDWLWRDDDVQCLKDRVPVYWGEFSQVEAITRLIRAGLESAGNYDYFVLLSGRDQPLRSGSYVEAFLEAHSGTEFMTVVSVPNEDAGKPLSRLNTIRYSSQKPILRFTFRVLAKFGLARRDYTKHVKNLTPYSGSTWWTLSREACQYLVEFESKDATLGRFLRKSFAPDEAYFQTILGNSPFYTRMRRNLLFEDWSAGGAHPGTLDARHLASFERHERIVDEAGNELLFARKFSDRDLHILRGIDAMIRRKEAAGESCERASFPHAALS